MKNRIALAAFLSFWSAAFFAQITAPLTVVCFDDCADFELPDGTTINCVPGASDYLVYFKDQNGLDSIVIFPVKVLPPILVSQNLSICAGDPIPPEPCALCTSADGCDSTNFLNLTIVQVNALINGGGAMPCAGPPKMLGSASSVGEKTWTNLQGATLGTGDDFWAEAPGTYVLTVKKAISASKTCVDRDTVTILSLDPPIQKLFSTVQNPDTSGAATGAVSVDSVAGGTAPFSFFWSTGATTASVTGLGAGKIWVVVTDSLGCEKRSNFLLENDPGPATPPDDSIHAATPGAIVWPNPTENSARLFLDEKTRETGGSIELFTADGRLVERRLFQKKEAETLGFDLNNQPPGLFWLKIQPDGERPFFKKLVKN